MASDDRAAVPGVQWRQPGWRIWVLALAVVPLGALWAVRPFLNAVYAPTGYLPLGAPGANLIAWWDGGGAVVCVGVAVFVILLALRVLPLRALVMAALAAATVVPWGIASLIVYLTITGESL